MSVKPFSLLLLTGLLLVSIASYAQEFHVDLTGDDGANGSEATPWESIQHAMDNATPGSTVYVHEGIYNERLYVNVSGEDGAYITFRNWQTDEVIVDGEGTTDPALVELFNVHHIVLDGFIFRNNFQADAIGVLIEGACDHITLRNLELYDIGFTEDSNAIVYEEDNAQPIIVYGSDSNHTITDLNIMSCEIHHCVLGYSEALAVNGNVEGFEIADNEISFVTNIGIDVIGHEGTCEDSLLDQARQGIIRRNTVYACDSPYSTAAGIYVDGGKQIVIEQNEVYACEWGIEIGCENVGKAASEIVVRSNFVHNNKDAGIAMGGYSYPNESGKVTDIAVVHNSLYGNGAFVPFNGEAYFTYIENGLFSNNILYVDNGGTILLGADGPPAENLLIDNNLFFTTEVETDNVFFWYNTNYQGTSTFNNGTGNCSNCPFGDPLFVSTEWIPDLHIQSGSAAIDAGSETGNTGALDFDGENRIAGPAPDFGADEFGSSLTVDNRKPRTFLVYPNPSSDYISLIGWGILQANVIIYDMNGNVVFEELTMTNTPLNIQHLSAGSYSVVFAVGQLTDTTTFIKK